MEKICVTLSANAGVAVHFGGRRIWVDALLDEKEPGFSTLSPQLQREMLKCEAFFKPDYICTTHCHPDHYSQKLMQTAKCLWPQAKLLLPEPELADQMLISGDRFCLKEPGITLEFIRLPHEGPQYADVKHYGLLLHADKKHVLIAGDCATASPVLAQALENLPIDLAILNFPWITLAKGREFLTKVLKPKHALICHLPFEEDDTSGYRRSARRNAEVLENQFDVRLLCDPLQTETIEI